MSPVSRRWQRVLWRRRPSAPWRVVSSGAWASICLCLVSISAWSRLAPFCTLYGNVIPRSARCDVCSSTWLNDLRREGKIDQGRWMLDAMLDATRYAYSTNFIVYYSIRPCVGGRGGKGRKTDWGLSVLGPSC